MTSMNKLRMIDTKNHTRYIFDNIIVVYNFGVIASFSSKSHSRKIDKIHKYFLTISSIHV